MSNTKYITTPIYYANARPHIGSAYPTIAADVLARFYRQQGNSTMFITGTAEHGDKIAASAAAADLDPQKFSDQNSEYFKLTWQSLDIEYDDFLRTTQPRHEESVIKFFNKLKESGDIYEGEYQGLYCVGHEAFIKESDLNEAGECPDHRKKPEQISETNWFFKLSKYADSIKEKITSGEFVIEPESRRNEVLSFIDQGLEDIAISRQNVDLAIKLPWDQNQTIYVWLDELFSYCSVIGYGKEGGTGDSEQSENESGEGSSATHAIFQKYWPASVHIVGKDIIKFHCIIWPALLMAINEEIPKMVYAHGFFTVNGEKISKSLGNAIDPVELVKEYNTDVIRYFLLRDIPFGADGDFSHDRLAERYNADLANGLGNLVSRTLNMMEQYNVLPPASPAVAPQERRRDKGELEGGTSTVKQLLDQAGTHTTNLNFDKALANIWQVIAWADELIEEKKPWQLAKSDSPSDKKELEEVLQTLHVTLGAINHSLAPYMPETHDKLTTLLAVTPIKKPTEPLFRRRQ